MTRLTLLGILVAGALAPGCKRDGAASSIREDAAAPDTAVSKPAFPLALFKTYCESCHGNFGKAPTLFPNLWTDDPERIRVGHEKAIAGSAASVLGVLDWEADAPLRALVSPAAEKSAPFLHAPEALKALAGKPEDRRAMIAALQPVVGSDLMKLPLPLFRSYCEACHSSEMPRYGDDRDLVQRQSIAQIAKGIYDRLSYEGIEAGKAPFGVRPMPAGKRNVLPREARAAMLNGLLPFLPEPRPAPVKAEDLKTYATP